MTSLNLGKVFFEALDYPGYARPNFFIIKQRESGWARGVYLKTLAEIYHTCIIVLQIKHGAQKRNQPGLKMVDMSLRLKDFEFLDEDIKAGNKEITKEILDELHLAILASYSFEKPEVVYTHYEILSCVEYALWFIRNEFKIQTNEINPKGFRPRTETYFIYHIAQDGPFFDFPKFKATIHELTLTSRNLQELVIKLKPFHKAAEEIVDLYNNKIYNLETTANADENNKGAEIVRVEFVASELNHTWWNDERVFEINYPRPYLNQDLAGYAAKIANFLAGIVLPRTRKELIALEKDFIYDFVSGIKLYNEQDYTGWKKPIKQNPKHEWPYRDWFYNWFGAQHYIVEKEPLKGAGRIDLKVSHGSIGSRKIEFKGWWDPRKKGLIQQLFGYLTTFDGIGYIVIINTTGKNISSEYQAMISEQVKTPDTIEWHDEAFDPTSYKYYRSTIKIKGFDKDVFHFILDMPLPVQRRKSKRKVPRKK